MGHRAILKSTDTVRMPFPIFLVSRLPTGRPSVFNVRGDSSSATSSFLRTPLPIEVTYTRDSERSWHLSAVDFYLLAD